MKYVWIYVLMSWLLVKFYVLPFTPAQLEKMEYVWNYVLMSWLLVKCYVLSFSPEQSEHTTVLDPYRDPSVLYCPEDALIRILNVSVINEEYCESEPCDIDDDDHEVLRRLCDNSTNCLIYGSNLSSTCLIEHRRFNMSYSCEAPFSLQCNFDNDFVCNLEQDIFDDFDWTKGSQGTPSTDTGPDSDHTTGSGFYMYIEANNRGKNRKANLISETIVCEVAHCLTFWYHMYGNHIGSLSVYQDPGTKVWGEQGNKDNQWKQAKVNLYCNGPFQIIIEGKIKNSEHRWLGDIALDDVIVFDESCENLEDAEYYDSCLSTNDQYEIEKCETHVLHTNSLNITLYPAITNSEFEEECSYQENEIKSKLNSFCGKDFLFTNCKFSLKSFFWDDSECVTFRKRMLITYLCTGSVTSARVMGDSNNLKTGLAVGLVIGALLLVCVVIVIVILIRRHTCTFKMFNSNQREKIRNNLGGNVYIGSQDTALPGLPSTANHSRHMQNSGIYNGNSDTSVHGYDSINVNAHINNVEHEYSNLGAAKSFVNDETAEVPTYIHRQDNKFADNHMSNDDEYAIVDSTAETSFNDTMNKRTGTADSYMVLDPTKTGFNRQIIANTPVGYEFAKPVKNTEKNNGDEDQYALSKEGVYDHSGSNRHKEPEDTIYNHSVDTVYDSGSHKRNAEGREDTYDHFIGQQTEDDYDISTTT